MKNDIADILFKYTTGEATLEETNDALKEAEAGFNLEPGRNEITPDEMALTTVGDTPEEANGFGLLDTGTGSMEKVHVTNGKLDEAINQVNHDGTTNTTSSAWRRCSSSITSPRSCGSVRQRSASISLFSQLQTRKNAVTGLDFEVIPFGDEPLDKEIADFIEEQLNGIESFEDVENDLLDAIGKGFAVSEILWGYDEGHVVVQDIKTRHQKRFFWDTLDDSFKVRTKDVPEGILLPANKFIVHRYKARSGHTSRAGILRVVAWMYLFKNYDLKDWVSFAEIYGLPLRLGKYAPGASDSDKAALMRALIQIGSDAAGIIPDGTSIDFITTEKTSSSDLYERLARYCDEQISKAILGQTLTSDSGGGSYAQSKTHNDVRHDLTVADCKALASTLRRDLIRPLCIFNFGEDKRIPYIRFDCEESEDLTQTATILGTLIEKVGLRIL